MSGATILLYFNRKIIKKLEESGATSPENAKTKEEAGLSNLESLHLNRLTALGKIRRITDKNGEERYYVPYENEK
jgi:hypothetical protein